MPNTINSSNNSTMTGATWHIPAGYIQPPEGYEIIWDVTGEPFYYRRNYLTGEHWDAEISLDPQTGEERINVDLNLDRATAKEARLAMGQLCAWFMVAVEARPLVGGMS